jgi:hypothetical protein
MKKCITCLGCNRQELEQNIEVNCTNYRCDPEMVRIEKDRLKDIGRERREIFGKRK